MKKKGSIVLLLVVMMALSIVGCTNIRNATLDATPVDGSKLSFEQKGYYNMPGFGEEFFIYRFDNPNSDIVVYQIDSIYLLGEDSGETGIIYADIYFENAQFMGLSENYLLFLTDTGKIAVSIEEKADVDVGESVLEKYSFYELTNEEKESFIYPMEYQKVTQVLPSKKAHNFNVCLFLFIIIIY